MTDKFVGTIETEGGKTAVKTKEPLYLVRDLLAKDAPRSHTLRNAKQQQCHVTFANNTVQAKVPQSFAITLVGNDGFEVASSDGKIIKPTHDNDETGETIKLAFDETIAKLDELTRNALLARCKKAGLSPKPKDANERLIELLMTAGDQSPLIPIVGSIVTTVGKAKKTEESDEEELEIDPNEIEEEEAE